MKSYAIAVCLIFLGLRAAAAGAQDAAKITVEPVAGTLYLLRHADSANALVSVGEDGMILVDDQSSGAAANLLATLQELTRKPLRFVINTHAHGDHSGGNDALGKLAPVIAHVNVRERMIRGREPRSPAAWPTVTFDRELRLHFNGEDIRLLKVPAGHTDGDIVAFFEKSRVVHVGDLYMVAGASFGDWSHGGSNLGLIEALEYLLPQIPADAKVIPGHGSVVTRADVARGLETLKGMKTIVEAAIAAGKTREQLRAEKPFEKWKTSIAWFLSTDAYVDDFYKELAPQ